LRENDDIALIQFDSIVNPAYPVEEYEEAKATMPADEFNMSWRGQATKLRTMIYSSYSKEANWVEHFEVPHNWMAAVGIDPIGTHIAAVWGALSPVDGKFHVYREYLEPFGATTAGHAKNILDMTNERVARWIVGQPAERQARLDWQAAGIPAEPPPFSDLWAGINRVYGMLQSGDMVIHSCCEGLLSEIGSYQREKDRATGEITDKIKGKDTFHLLDSLRYMVADLSEPRDRQEVQYRPGRFVPFQ